MAFLTKALDVTREREKQDSDRQHTFFDCTNLPDLAAERIASFLDGKDLISLGNTCKFWNEVSQRNTIWKTLVEKRFGRKVILDPGSSQIEYKKCYFKLAESKKSATAFHVAWLNGSYLKKVKDKESEFGEVIQLRSACKLQIYDFFLGVLPGKYSLVWRMKFDRVYAHGLNSQGTIRFIARPEKGCGNKLCSKWTEDDFKNAESQHGSGEWYVQTMGDFDVTATCKVYVEIMSWCGGISWDYAELRPRILMVNTQNT